MVNVSGQSRVGARQARTASYIGAGVATGGGGVSADMKARAQKIVTAAQGWSARSVTSSPPTITRSAAYGASTIGGGDAGAPSILPTDNRLLWTGPLYALGGSWYGGWKTGDMLLDGGDGWGTRFKSNARVIEVSLGYGRVDQTFQGRVNGQWYSVSDIALFGSSPTSDYRFLRLDFGSTALRNHDLFFRTVQDTRGINISAGATLALPDTNAADVTASIFGDSLVEAGGGLYKNRENPAQLLGEKLGIADIITMGRSNQGFVVTRDGRTIAGRMVLDSPKIANRNLDLVISFGSYNDNAQTPAAIQSSTQAGVAALMTNFPNAFILHYSSWAVQNGNTFTAARNAASRDGALAAKGSDPRVLVRDTMALGAPLTATVAGGSADLIHGGNVDVDNHTTWWKADIIAALKAAAGIA